MRCGGICILVQVYSKRKLAIEILLQQEPMKSVLLNVIKIPYPVRDETLHRCLQYSDSATEPQRLTSF